MRLLRILADGRFHSGEALGAELGISRSAVAKRLQQLEESQGIKLFAVRGKGYCLDGGLSLLDPQRLQAQLPGVRLLVEDTLASTNSTAMQCCRNPDPPCAVLTECQTAGRGRRGRQWVSPYAQNLYVSRILRVDQPTTQLEAPSLVVGLAVIHALRQQGIADCALKWPNDILVGGRKIGGILLELTGDPADSCHVVIGIGINVNMQQAVIDQAWTSMREQLGKVVDRTVLAVDLLRCLDQLLLRHREAGFAPLRAEWEAAHAWQGREVCLSGGREPVYGRVLGVSADGALRLQVAGEEQVFTGGELSLRLHDDS